MPHCVHWVSGLFLGDLDHYEVVQPRRVDHAGHFLSDDFTHSATSPHRAKRSARNLANSTRDSDETSPHERIFYKLSAYGIDFHLNLTRNNRLVSPSFLVQYWNKDGVARQHNDVEHCHYEGHIVNREGRSSVALSNCRGLVSETLSRSLIVLDTCVFAQELCVHIDAAIWWDWSLVWYLHCHYLAITTFALFCSDFPLLTHETVSAKR